MFFNKNILKMTRTLNNISPPILIRLAVEDNLVNDSDSFWFSTYVNHDYSNYYSLRSLLHSNLYIQFSDHEQQIMFQSTYNLNLKETNSISCSTGNSTYFYFPVQITSKNITGSLRINFDAYIANDRAFSTVILTIHNGEGIIINCCLIHVHVGCNGDLLYDYSSETCVESCSLCEVAVAGSCQSFAKLGMCTRCF